MEKIISIKNLTYEIPHTGTILKDINLEVGPNEILGVLGHNGAGKTTLLDLLMGFRNSPIGQIQVLGEDPNGSDRKQKDKVVFLSHDVSLKGGISISQFLKFSSAFYPDYSYEDEEELLRIFDLTRDMQIGALSTGQQKKIQFIAGAATRPKLIIVDEVTAVFDPETRDLFFNQLQEVRKQYGTSIILSTNIADDLTGFVDKVLFIKDMKAHFHSTEEISHLFKIGQAA